MRFFQKLDALLRAEGRDEVAIMVIGPGAVTAATGPLLNDAANEDASRIRRWIGDAARYGDQVLRRVPFMPLRSLEPVEVTRTLTVPHRLIVVDRSRRVLAAVARQLPGAEIHCCDVSFQSPPRTADAVIAFNVVCRLDDPEAGLKNVVAAVCPGGYLLIDDRSARGRIDAYSDLHPVAPKTFRRASA